jgi:hypothetical protein
VFASHDHRFAAFGPMSRTADVAAVFRSSEEVNKVLRLAITHSAKRATARPAKKLSSKKAR